MKGIITSDWHLRSTVPQCCANTKTEWMDIQRKAVDQVIDVACKENCNVYIVGDLHHKVADISFECLDITLSAGERLKKEVGKIIYYIAGNHDLKNHSMDNFKDSACGVLSHYDFCKLLQNDTNKDIGASCFGQEPEDRKYIFKHILCIPEKDKPDYVECETPSSLASKYKNAEYIFLGDYHKKFIEKVKNGSGKDCLVINPGCLTIQAADFQNYQPSVYVFDSEEQTIGEIPIINDEKFIVNEKGIIKEDASIETFIEAVKNNSEMTLDYISNLDKVIISESEQVQQKVRSWI